LKKLSPKNLSALTTGRNMTFQTTVVDEKGVGVEGLLVIANDEMNGKSFLRSTDGKGYADVAMPGCEIDDRVTIAVQDPQLRFKGLVLGDAKTITPGDEVLRLVVSPFKRGSVGAGGAGVSLEQLARIRGSMWTARLNLPYGPRPGSDDNILSMDFYEFFGPEDRKRMIEAYKARGYTHAVTGPIVDAGGYHGQYPLSDFRDPAKFEWYLDAMQEWWDAGIIPIHFVKPDNWSLEDMEQFVPLYSSPRARALLRILVPAGWEPWKYEVSSLTWAEFFKWGHRVNPEALILGHTVGDVDAMAGTDARFDDNGKGNDTAWDRVVPYLHGWLIQLGGYVFMEDSTGQAMDRHSPEFPAKLTEFKANMADYIGGHAGITKRFREGYAGWPTSSMWGPNIPIKIYLAEYAAYIDYWKNWPEDEARDLGDIAIKAGADGYLDGGRVDVP
jgi:hypothetical protein